MRARLVLLIVAILLVTGFAALNWGEFTRSTPLNFGLFQMDGPLGAILLGLLGLGLLLFLVSSAALRSRMLITENRYTRDLQAQRDLADKAEASRFTELRQHLDNHFRESRQRETLASAEFEKSMLQSQRELHAQLEQLHHALVSRLGDLENRVERSGPVVDVPHRPLDVPPRDRAKV
jgi:uncharacterized integral membrane protein